MKGRSQIYPPALGAKPMSPLTSGVKLLSPPTLGKWCSSKMWNSVLMKARWGFGWSTFGKLEMFWRSFFSVSRCFSSTKRYKPSYFLCYKLTNCLNYKLRYHFSFKLICLFRVDIFRIKYILMHLCDLLYVFRSLLLSRLCDLLYVFRSLFISTETFLNLLNSYCLLSIFNIFVHLFRYFLSIFSNITLSCC